MAPLHTVRSLQLAAAASGIAAVCSIGLAASQAHMSAAVEASGSNVASLAPDMRFGYSEDELAALLGALGPDGRAAYAVAEAIDLGAYMWAYGAILLVLLNILGGLVGRALGVPLLRTHSCWLAPAVVAADVVEDLLQLLAVAAYNRAAAPGGGGALESLDSLPPWWRSVAAAAATANRTKVVQPAPCSHVHAVCVGGGGGVEGVESCCSLINSVVYVCVGQGRRKRSSCK